jgi:uncharacterized protein YjbI with pentapeptide repeats
LNFTNTELLQVLNSHEAFLRGDPVGVKICLEAANLYGANIANHDLSQACLAGGNLRRVLAWATKFHGADLRKANFKHAVLESADLSEADLRGAVFIGVNLENANFCGANLDGAVFSGSFYTGAKYDSQTILPQDFDPESAGMIFVQNH